MMISYNRGDFDSASQWLEALRHDDAWLSQLQQLQEAAPRRTQQASSDSQQED